MTRRLQADAAATAPPSGAPRSELQLYRLLARQARPYRAHLTGVLVLSLLAAPLALLTPVPIKVAVDSGLGSHPPPAFLQPLLGDGSAHMRVLYGAAALLVLVALLTALQTLALNLLRSYTGERLVFALRTRLFEHLQRLSLAYHDERGTPDAVYRVQYDAQAIQYLAVDGLIPFVAAGCTLAGMLYVTARIDWQLALVALAVSPVLFVVARVYRVRLRRGARGVKAIESNALGVVQEVLTQLRVVKAFAQEEREQERFAQRSREGVRARLRLVLSEETFGLLVGTITALGTGAVLLIGAVHVRSGAITLGDLMLVLGYLAELYEPLRTMSKQLTGVQDSLASAERVFAVLAEPSDVPERADARPLERASGRIVFDRVSFAYPGCSPTLHDVSIDVASGTRVGIEGTTGAGKTTLVSLLARLYDPTAGRIVLDGVDLRDYRLRDLRNQFAVVLQEPVLFAGTISENIAYARADATDDEIVAAATAACAHDFIVALPDGYDTVVGERGMRLSGGERQRLSLARAFLKDAPILILDEPTSALDAATEAVLLEIQERAMASRTCIVVAHRPRLLDGCDLRLRVERGRLVQVHARDAAAPAPPSSSLWVTSDAPRPARPEQPGGRRARKHDVHRPPARVVTRRHGVVDRARDRLPPEVWQVAGRLFGGSDASPRVVADEPLKRAVHRIWFDVRGSRVSVVAKRLSRRRARVNELVAQRWLPAVGLDRACPQVRGTVVDPDGHAVWQLYEDVGGRQLDPRRSDGTVDAAVELIARVHARCAGHHMLAECQNVGEDLGATFFDTYVPRCLQHLRSVGPHPDDRRTDVRDRLLGRIEQLHAERHERARVLEACGGPVTLLHGDLWTTNILVVDGSDRAGTLLVDWDHAGAGPVAYDLSTFLYRFPRDDRRAILVRYREALSAHGRDLPTDADLDVAFTTAEYARYACCLSEAAKAAARGEFWGFDQLAEIESWFATLEPVLPTRGRDV